MLKKCPFLVTFLPAPQIPRPPPHPSTGSKHQPPGRKPLTPGAASSGMYFMYVYAWLRTFWCVRKHVPCMSWCADAKLYLSGVASPRMEGVFFCISISVLLQLTSCHTCPLCPHSPLPHPYPLCYHPHMPQSHLSHMSTHTRFTLSNTHTCMIPTNYSHLSHSPPLTHSHTLSALAHPLTPITLSPLHTLAHAHSFAHESLSSQQ